MQVLRTEGSSFPKLEYLGLTNSKHTNVIAQAVAQSLIIGSLKVLDISKGKLTDKGAINLLKEPMVNYLHTLNVSENRLTKKMGERLSQLRCRVIADSQFRNRKPRQQSRDRYYSVWE